MNASQSARARLKDALRNVAALALLTFATVSPFPSGRASEGLMSSAG